MTARDVLGRLGGALAGLSPRAILVIGWLVMMLYAYPGYMSFDSVYQLLEARSGTFGDAHPPMMSALWRMVDGVIPGPFGMLVLQTVCFQLGAYLLLQRRMSRRAAAICASVVLLLPPVSAVMAVIWKDAQMAGYLVLGTALVLSPRRWIRIVALLLFVAATGMRHNALAMTGPLVFLLFTWNPAHRWWKRYPIALVAWVAVTFSAQTISGAMTSQRTYLWHDALALWDIVGTLRYAPPIPDADLREIFEGVPVIPTEDIQAHARKVYRPEEIKEKLRQAFGAGTYVPALWTTTYHFFDIPTTMPQRAAIARAWKQIVPKYPLAYLEYRWHVFRERIQLNDEPVPGSAYIWFTDVLDPPGSAAKTGHIAVPGRIQDVLRGWMWDLGSSWMFRPWIYLALSFLLLVFVRDRETFAMIASGVASEAALFLLAPTIDYRYSFWLVISTLFAIVMLIARRARPIRSGG